MIIVLTAYPGRKSADAAARRIVQADLAACINILRIETSIFKWEGKLKEGAEFLLIIKARAANYEKLESAIRENHPYELPEIIRIPIDGGFAPYLDWVERTGEAGFTTGPRSKRS